jgi:hypothetical protein
LEEIIARDRGQFGKARKKLGEVVDFFVDRNLGVEVFHASLDLAKVYALWRRRRQAKRTLQEVIPLGKALGLYKEVFEARLLYEQVSRG